MDAKATTPGTAGGPAATAIKTPAAATAKNELESASEYLGRHNFKTLVEWLTAEVILNRPRDPLAFLRDVICEKIDLRQGRAYNVADSLGYAKACYQEASEAADEDGNIKPRQAPRRPATLADTNEMRQRLATLEQAIASSRVIAKQLDPHDATEAIVRETCTLLNCDRATLFTSDPDANELVLMVAKGADRIRLPIGQGVAGTVAATGRLCNIPDAYQDARFNSAHDEQSGYKTTSVLAAPVIDGDGNTIGVVQAINRFPDKNKPAGQSNYVSESKNGGGAAGPAFTEVDEEMIGVLAAQAGIALNNAMLYQGLSLSKAKVLSLLDIIQAMHSNLGVNSILFTITQRVHELVEADRCTMFLLDEASKELMSLQGEVSLRIPMDKGIAGECCVKNEVINIADAYADPRFNQEVDKKSGYRTRTILCMPCQNSDGSVVGVIQLINKRHGVFNDDDLRIMESFLVVAGPLLAQSRLFQERQKVAENEFTGKAAHGSARGLKPEKSIAEGDDEAGAEDEE